eukprot:338717-Amorphochlora_amoeboformis.AAC.1
MLHSISLLILLAPLSLLRGERFARSVNFNPKYRLFSSGRATAGRCPKPKRRLQLNLRRRREADIPMVTAGLEVGADIRTNKVLGPSSFVALLFFGSQFRWVEEMESDWGPFSTRFNAKGLDVVIRPVRHCDTEQLFDVISSNR